MNKIKPSIFNVEEELREILAAEISQEIDREIMEKIYKEMEKANPKECYE